MRIAVSAMFAAIVAITAPLQASCDSHQRGEKVRSGVAIAHQEGSHWTALERWAWTQIAAGRAVRLPGTCPDWQHTGKSSGGKVDPSAYTLSGRFVRQVLTEPMSSAIPVDRPLIIRGARITGDVELDGGVSRVPLIVDCSMIEGTVSFEEWEFLRRFEFSRVRVSKSLEFYDVEARSGITVRQSDVDLIQIMRSRIDHDLSLRATRVRSLLKIVSTTVGHALLMGCDVRLPESSRCATYGRTEFIDVVTSGALDLIGSQFPNVVRFEGLDVGGSLLARNADYLNVLQIVDGVVDGRLDISSSRLRSLDLSGTTVRGELRVGSPKQEINWDGPGDAARFIARNTRVGRLHDTRSSWPALLRREFDGFEYGKLSGLDGGLGKSAYLRRVEWFKTWLAGDDSYSPQPYRHLSKLLRREGQWESADAILYEARERERAALSWRDLRRWWLEFLRWSVGYGVGLKALCALLWMAGFAGLGWIVGCCATRGRRVSPLTLLWYSVSFTVPGFGVVSDDEVTVSTLARSWFYLQRLFCYALALVAGAVVVGIVEP